VYSNAVTTVSPSYANEILTGGAVGGWGGWVGGWVGGSNGSFRSSCLKGLPSRRTELGGDSHSIHVDTDLVAPPPHHTDAPTPPTPTGWLRGTLSKPEIKTKMRGILNGIDVDEWCVCVRACVWGDVCGWMFQIGCGAISAFALAQGLGGLRV